MADTVLLWFNRDLRLADHPALTAALAGERRVVPVYIHDPTNVPGAASRWWLHHSLGALRSAIEQRGSRLILRSGDSTDELNRLIDDSGASAVYTHRRPIASNDMERRLSVPLRQLGGDTLYAPEAIHSAQGTPYRIFTPFHRTATRVPLGAPLPAPARLPAVNPTLPSLSLDELGLLPTIPWDAAFSQQWSPGEAEGWRRWESFSSSALEHYPQQRDQPAVDGTSALSPHLAFGEISPRQLVAAIRAADVDDGARESWLRQLHWREFAYHLLHHFPRSVDAPFNPRYAEWPWREDAESLRRWQRGETGIPVIDAGMRQLWQSGWMHNRVRMLVASLLTKSLLIDWRHGAAWFMDTLVDADLANNTLGWQWVAGCGADAAPYFRIFNPVAQSRKFDPQGHYLRQWLPELAALPDRWIHEPAAAPVAVLARAGVTIGTTYPSPIVDLNVSRRRALAIYQSVIGAGRG